MVIFCEECGAKNILDGRALFDHSSKPRCIHCRETLKMGALRGSGARLQLKFGDKVIEMGRERGRVTLGRSPDNDIVVEDKTVSRFHALILQREGGFFLIDHSRNGTHVEIDEGRAAIIKQNEFPLSGHGYINPVLKAGPGSPDPIHFTILK